MLKQRINKLEDVDEAFRSAYKPAPDGNGFVLDAEPPADLSKLEEFRNNNRALNTKVEELTAQITTLGQSSIKPEELEELRSAKKKLDELSGQQLLEEGKIDEFVQQRTAEMKSNFEHQITTLTESRDQAAQQNAALVDQLTTLKVESSVNNAVSAVGVLRQGAQSDVLNRARQDWQVDAEGNLKPRAGLIDAQGDAITSMEQWGKNLLGTASYLFESGGGGGAGGGGQHQRQQQTPVVKIGPGVRTTAADLKRVAAGEATFEGNS